jgi:hypothetical protein
MIKSKHVVSGLGADPRLRDAELAQVAVGSTVRRATHRQGLPDRRVGGRGPTSQALRTTSGAGRHRCVVQDACNRGGLHPPMRLGRVWSIGPTDASIGQDMSCAPS